MLFTGFPVAEDISAMVRPSIYMTVTLNSNEDRSLLILRRNSRLFSRFISSSSGFCGD